MEEAVDLYNCQSRYNEVYNQISITSPCSSRHWRRRRRRRWWWRHCAVLRASQARVAVRAWSGVYRSSEGVGRLMYNSSRTVEYSLASWEVCAMKDGEGGISSVVECCAELPVSNAAWASSFLFRKRTSRLHTLSQHNDQRHLSVQKRQYGELLCAISMPLHSVCDPAHPLFSYHLNFNNFDSSSKLAGSRTLPSPATTATIV